MCHNPTSAKRDVAKRQRECSSMVIRRFAKDVTIIDNHCVKGTGNYDVTFTHTSIRSKNRIGRIKNSVH